MSPEFPYLICRKTVAKQYKAVCCYICHKLVQIACNNIKAYTYQKLQNSKAPQYCIYAT